MSNSSATLTRFKSANATPNSKGSDNVRIGMESLPGRTQPATIRAISIQRKKAGLTRLSTGIVAAVVIPAAGWFALTSMSAAEAEATPEARLLAVETSFAEPITSYRVAREYTGAIVARRPSRLGFESSGKVQKIHVDEGDRVAAATPLAALDTEHLQIKRQQIVARRAQATAKLAS